MVHFTFHEANVPDGSPVTGIVVVPFVDGQCIMADVRGRPGHEFTVGHTEPGETPEQAATRELKEETGAEAGSLQRVGHVLCHNDDAGEHLKFNEVLYLDVLRAARRHVGV